MESPEVPAPEPAAVDRSSPSPAGPSVGTGLSVPVPVAAGLLCLGLGLGVVVGARLARKLAEEVVAGHDAELERLRGDLGRARTIAAQAEEELARVRAPERPVAAPAPAAADGSPVTNGAGGASGGADPTRPFSPVAAAVVDEAGGEPATPGA